MLGVYLCCRAVIPAMIERGRGRIVLTGERGRVPARFEVDGVQLEQGGRQPVRRDARPPAGALRIGVFPISPGLVRTEMTEDAFPDDAPWTPPEAAPRLVRELATGRFDALSGRYLHAEHDRPTSSSGASTRS